jgi:type I restriction enzyme S subunit
MGNVADLNWGDTSKTKSSYIKDSSGFVAYSATGPDGFLESYDYDRTGIVLSAIGALAGKTWLASGKWSCIKNTIRIFSVDEELVRTEFLYWVSSVPNYWPRRGSAQPFISKGDADSILVPIPPLQLQDEICKTLRSLQALVQDINSGLPAEIKARRKQYEYYRDKLLTFNEMKAS